MKLNNRILYIFLAIFRQCRPSGSSETSIMLLPIFSRWWFLIGEVLSDPVYSNLTVVRPCWFLFDVYDFEIKYGGKWKKAGREFKFSKQWGGEGGGAGNIERVLSNRFLKTTTQNPRKISKVKSIHHQAVSRGVKHKINSEKIFGDTKIYLMELQTVVFGTSLNKMSKIYITRQR